MKPSQCILHSFKKVEHSIFHPQKRGESPGHNQNAEDLYNEYKNMIEFHCGFRSVFVLTSNHNIHKYSQIFTNMVLLQIFNMLLTRNSFATIQYQIALFILCRRGKHANLDSVTMILESKVFTRRSYLFVSDKLN